MASNAVVCWSLSALSTSTFSLGGHGIQLAGLLEKAGSVKTVYRPSSISVGIVTVKGSRRIGQSLEGKEEIRSCISRLGTLGCKSGSWL